MYFFFSFTPIPNLRQCCTCFGSNIQMKMLLPLLIRFMLIYGEILTQFLRWFEDFSSVYWYCNKSISMRYDAETWKSRVIEFLLFLILYHGVLTLSLLYSPSILVTNSLVTTPTKSPISNHHSFLFHVTKMCCIIHLRFWVWNVYRNRIIRHILVTWNRKIGDLRLVIWLVTSPKYWTARTLCMKLM